MKCKSCGQETNYEHYGPFYFGSVSDKELKSAQEMPRCISFKETNGK